ncbi:MAG TPA: WecB/TagA/CpsF family glycosyltransferase [Nitrospirales bacterium]|nr:WecB/TagA/CpsF family glycosyltransferase [Nitrospirales bacterium]
MNTIGMLPSTSPSELSDSTKGMARQHSPCPPKFNLFGIGVSRTDYQEATILLIQAAQERRSLIVDHMPVHGLIEACSDSSLKNKINQFDIVAPDGQPVRWALNRFHQANLSDRVYGPELMLRLCHQAEQKGVGVYLYGSQPEVLGGLKRNLLHRFPSLRIVGAEAPPFRPLTQDEDQAAVARINASGAGLIFLGLGCPKQEHFAFDHREKIHGVQLCVGAAFDFHAGTKEIAPPWMQRNSLEWVFRLWCEPKRLWKRYFVTNSIFLWKILRHEFGILK